MHEKEMKVVIETDSKVSTYKRQKDTLPMEQGDTLAITSLILESSKSRGGRPAHYEDSPQGLNMFIQNSLSYFEYIQSCNIELEQIKADMKPSKLQKDKSVISTDKLNGLIELAEQGIAATAAAAQAQKKMKTMIPKNQHEKAVTDLVYKNNELMNNNRTLQAENDKLKRFRDKAIERGLFDAIAAPENESEKQAQSLKKREIKER